MKYPLAIHFLLTSTLTSYTKHTLFNNILPFYETYTQMFSIYFYYHYIEKP